MGHPLPGTQGWDAAQGLPLWQVQAGEETLAGSIIAERGVSGMGEPQEKPKDGDSMPSPPRICSRETVHLAPLPSPSSHCAWWDPWPGYRAAAVGGEGSRGHSGWAREEVGGLVAASGWVLWGETSVLRAEKGAGEAGLGVCVGLAPAAWGAPVAAHPCSGSSKMPARIWHEPALCLRGGSQAATSPLCPQMGVLWGTGSPLLLGCSDIGVGHMGRDGATRGPQRCPVDPPAQPDGIFPSGPCSPLCLQSLGVLGDPLPPSLGAWRSEGQPGHCCMGCRGPHYLKILPAWLCPPLRSTFSLPAAAGSERTFLLRGAHPSAPCLPKDGAQAVRLYLFIFGRRA